jgi:hypothetical protein
MICAKHNNELYLVDLYGCGICTQCIHCRKDVVHTFFIYTCGQGCYLHKECSEGYKPGLPVQTMLIADKESK